MAATMAVVSLHREEEVRALLERVAGLEEELAGERRDRGELEAQVDPSCTGSGTKLNIYYRWTN